MPFWVAAILFCLSVAGIVCAALFLKAKKTHPRDRDRRMRRICRAVCRVYGTHVSPCRCRKPPLTNAARQSMTDAVGVGSPAQHRTPCPLPLPGRTARCFLLWESRVPGCTCASDHGTGKGAAFSPFSPIPVCAYRLSRRPLRDTSQAPGQSGRSSGWRRGCSGNPS